MFGLLFSSITTIVQAGAIIGMGILLDTRWCARSPCPRVATLLGNLSWWPAKLRPTRPEPAEPPKPTVFEQV